jgi:hypothetical protein
MVIGMVKGEFRFGTVFRNKSIAVLKFVVKASMMILEDTACANERCEWF